MSLITVAFIQFDNVTSLLSYRCDDKTIIIIYTSIIETFYQNKTKTSKYRYIVGQYFFCRGKRHFLKIPFFDKSFDFYVQFQK